MLDGEAGVVEGQSAGEFEIDRVVGINCIDAMTCKTFILLQKNTIYTRSLGPRFFAGIGTVVIPFSFSVET